MKKVSDLIAERLAYYGVKHVFTVTGGGAMHLNVSLGRNKSYECVYNHHEQACAVAAESYARLTNKIAPVCVTSGPGGTNAITGVFGAWVDSIPMLVISGQVKYETTVRSTGLPLRQLGDQELDISKMVSGITKYAVMVTEPREAIYHLDRAWHLAQSGRQGPCWVDVPLDLQGAFVDEAQLRVYSPAEDAADNPPAARTEIVREALARLKNAKRPVILAGTGIRLSGAHEKFLQAAELLNVPVATAWNAHDVLGEKHRLYVGRPNVVGDRAGNFAVQNADALLVLGCRLNVRQISYNFSQFAREAFKIIVEIDSAELKKPTIKPDLPVQADLADFLDKLLLELGGKALPVKKDWLSWCLERRRRYPVVEAKHRAKAEPVNPYVFVEELGRRLASDELVVCGDGSACVCTFQALKIGRGMRLYTNSGCASMGYDLPAALGACFGAEKRRVVCLAGDGSVQMNLQELQTIAHHKLPVKIFWLNNSGYHSIRQTQHNFFGGGLVGCDPESGVSFPDAAKIAKAYGFAFKRAASHKALGRAINATLKADGPALCEIVLDPEQSFEPRVSSKKLESGKIVSAPLEDMYPFLDRKEFLENMLIKPVD